MLWSKETHDPISFHPINTKMGLKKYNNNIYIEVLEYLRFKVM